MADVHKLVFIAGLRSSGAIHLMRLLEKSPGVSCFSNTGAPDDDGDYVQTLLPSGKTVPWREKFAFQSEARLTVDSPLATNKTADSLMQQWAAHWDLSKSVLVEKSPFDLLRTRFLQKLFRDAYFVVVKRHPIENCLITARLGQPNYELALRHWIAAHEYFEEDRPFLNRVHEVRFEDLVENTESTLAGVTRFLGLSEIPPEDRAIRAHRFCLWDALQNCRDAATTAQVKEVRQKYGDRTGRLGYPLSPSAETATVSTTTRPRHGTRPDFLVIGAQKAGTSSLFRYLMDHPDMLAPFKKELHFFDHPDEYSRGIGWYESMFPAIDRTNGRGLRLTGEATPYYLSEPRVPSLVAHHYPRMRLIAILRNPVDRAYSHYQMGVRKGLETLSFEDAIATEDQRLRAERERLANDPSYEAMEMRNYSYLERGRYVEGLRRWSSLFPRDQLLVLNGDDLRNKHAQTMDRVFEFVGARPWTSTNTTQYNSYPYPKMKPETRKMLTEYFAPHNRLLYDFLGVDFGWN